MQNPDCGRIFSSFAFKGTQNPAIVLNLESQSITVQSNDASLAGEDVELTLSFDALDTVSIASVKDLSIRVVFVTDRGNLQIHSNNDTSDGNGENATIFANLTTENQLEG